MPRADLVLPSLLLAALLGASGPTAPTAGPVAGERAPVADERGTIEGTVLLDLPAARRSTSRYPGSGLVTARQHDVPPVVWLSGDLPPAPAMAEQPIRQTDGRFVPGALAVTVNSQVGFPNDDSFYHNVFSYSGPRFDLGRFPAGQSRRVRLTEPGIVEVFCEVHEFMRATILVTEHDFHAVAGEDGSFRIDRVPAGTYRLHAWHPDVGETSTDVTVTDGRPTSVTLEWGP